jgi:hypothetical protein
MWDPTCDIVVLPRKFLVYQLDVLKALFHFQLKDMKTLAVPACFWLIDHSHRAPFSIMSIIGKAFPNLEELIIFLGGETDRRAWDNNLPFEPLLRLSPASHVSQNINHGLNCIRREFPEWPLSTVKVWEAEDDTDTLYREVFRVLVGPDKLPAYRCWCRPARWDTSVHNMHGPEGVYFVEFPRYVKEIDCKYSASLFRGRTLARYDMEAASLREPFTFQKSIYSVWKLR